MPTLKPILRCNLDCVGCYERTTLNPKNPRPDIDAMIATMARARAGEPAVLHGGEVTLLRIDEAERLCAAAKEQQRPLVMQTNGTLMTDAWLDLIDRYEINVGVSLNGPGTLNRTRFLENAAVTDRMTARVHEAVARLAGMKRISSIIVVLSQTNAGTDEALETLIEWAAVWLGETHGIWSIRWNPLFGGGAEELTPSRLTAVYKRLLAATVVSRRRAWLPFREWIDNLNGLGLAPCWMKPCDPYKTSAVHAIFHDGSEGSCLRTSPDGTPWQRAAEGSLIRQEILFQIPMAEGGCGGCRYWNFCHGGCPAEGEAGDWRNKTRWCPAILKTYKAIEDGLGGWLPNWVPAPAWTTDEPSAPILAASIENRQPMVNAFHRMTEGERRSTYEGSGDYTD